MVIGDTRHAEGSSSFVLTRFPYANRGPPAIQVRGRLLLENALAPARRHGEAWKAGRAWRPRGSGGATWNRPLPLGRRYQPRLVVDTADLELTFAWVLIAPIFLWVLIELSCRWCL